jgi:hypothetical protein
VGRQKSGIKKKKGLDPKRAYSASLDAGSGLVEALVGIVALAARKCISTAFRSSVGALTMIVDADLLLLRRVPLFPPRSHRRRVDALVRWAQMDFSSGS